MVSVTEQWAQFAVAGSSSARGAADASSIPTHDISNEAFPYLAVGEVSVCGGTPARLFRLSFSGELAYEIAVPARFGDLLVRAIMDAGAPFGIAPYGTEALGVLRIEKGHPAGGELNGQTTAHDLGMGKMLSTKKDFIGRFMAARPALTDPARADSRRAQAGRAGSAHSRGLSSPAAGRRAHRQPTIRATSPRSPSRPRSAIGWAWVFLRAGPSVTARSCASTIPCAAAISSPRSVRPASSIRKGRASVSSPLKAKSALAGIAVPGRYGRTHGEPGIVISERIGLGLATVAARKGKADALKQAVASAYGVELPAKLAHRPRIGR